MAHQIAHRAELFEGLPLRQHQAEMRLAGDLGRHIQRHAVTGRSNQLIRLVEHRRVDPRLGQQRRRIVPQLERQIAEAFKASRPDHDSPRGWHHFDLRCVLVSE